MAAEPVIPGGVLAALEPLPEAWLANLEARCAWSRDQVELWALRLWRDPKSGEERVAIPIIDSGGKLRNVRLFRPETDFYSTTNIWVEGLNKRSQGKARLWPNPSLWLAADKRPLWICASEAEALAVMSQTLDGNPEPPACAVTAKPGAWPYAFNNSIKGRDVILAWPHDAGHQEAARQAAEKMQKAAASVLLIKWPEPINPGYLPQDKGKGVMDWLTAGHSLDDLLHLAREAGAGEWIKPPVPAEEGEAGGKPSPLRFFEPGPSGHMGFKPAALAAEIMAEMDIITDRESKVSYLWEGRYWRTIEAEDIKRIALTKLEGEATNARAEDATKQVIAHSFLPPGQALEPDLRYLCLQNGMLDLDTLEVLPHEKRYKATYIYLWTFDPAQPRACDYSKAYFAQTIGDGRVIDEVQEFFGYVLWPGCEFEKALFCIGRPGSGKGTLLHVLRALVGPDNSASIDLSRLEDTFAAAGLHNKALNVYFECDRKMFSSKAFNAITSGDPLRASYKYKDEFDLVPRCKLGFSANRFPQPYNATEAYFDRVLPIHYTRKFRGTGRQDPHLKDKLMAELPGIFDWAVVGLCRLRARGGFRESPPTKKYLDRYRQTVSWAQAFIKECCTVGPEEVEIKRRIYRTYKVWCKLGERRAQAENRFWEEIYEERPEVKRLAHVPASVAESRPPGVQGLGLSENAPTGLEIDA